VGQGYIWRSGVRHPPAGLQVMSVGWQPEKREWGTHMKAAPGKDQACNQCLAVSQGIWISLGTSPVQCATQ
jgi:hypothetical protein